MMMLMTSVFAISSIHADIIPPKHQAKIGISADDIVCESGLFKITKNNGKSIACVKPTSVSKLEKYGWIQTVDEKALADIINRKSIKLGTINVLEIVPVKTNVGKLSSNAPISSYDVIFEICASPPIYAPDILARSDSETKHYEIPDFVSADSCIMSAVNLKASDTNSIKITLQNKGDISEKIVSLQTELDSLLNQLSTIRNSLKDSNDPQSQKLGQQIADLRHQINEKREELHRLLFTIHASPTSQQKIGKISFTGKPIDGESAEIISVKQSQTSGVYDAIFQACAGNTLVRLPVIIVSSDIQSIDVKLGDKISRNSCQMTSVKIEANDPESVMASPAGNADSSTKAAELEASIISMQSELTQEKEKLKSLIHDPKRPDTFGELVDAQVSKISILRDSISAAKAEFNKLMYLAYN